MVRESFEEVYPVQSEYMALLKFNKNARWKYCYPSQRIVCLKHVQSTWVIRTNWLGAISNHWLFPHATLHSSNFSMFEKKSSFRIEWLSSPAACIAIAWGSLIITPEVNTCYTQAEKQRMSTAGFRMPAMFQMEIEKFNGTRTARCRMLHPICPVSEFLSIHLPQRLNASNKPVLSVVPPPFIC